MPVILVLGSLRHSDHEFEVSLDFLGAGVGSRLRQGLTL